MLLRTVTVCVAGCISVRVCASVSAQASLSPSAGWTCTWAQQLQTLCWDWDGETLGHWDQDHARLGCSCQEGTTLVCWSLLDLTAPFTSLTLNIFISCCQFCLVYHIQVYYSWHLKKKIFIFTNGIRKSDTNKADIFQFYVVYFSF